MAEQRCADDLERALLAFRDLVHALRVRHHPGWLDLDLTMAQVKALMVIGSAGAIHGRGLAQALGVGQPAVSKLVEQLVERGYVRRDEDPEDRRIVWLRPTERGQALYDTSTVAGRESLRAILAALDPQQLAVVVEALSILARTAERLAAQPPAPILGEERS